MIGERFCVQKEKSEGKTRRRMERESFDIQSSIAYIIVLNGDIRYPRRVDLLLCFLRARVYSLGPNSD